MMTFKIISIVLVLVYTIILIAIKGSWIDQTWISLTSATSKLSMVSYFNLALLGGVMIWGFWILENGTRNNGTMSVISGIMILLFCLWHSGHIVVRHSEKIKDQWLVWILQEKTYDRQLANYNAEGYDRNFHNLSGYDCYEFCDGFFTREYQTSLSDNLIIYKGFGPLFTLSNDRFWQ